jgi:hypothetical protein
MGTTYEHPAGRNEYIGPYSGSYANTVGGKAKNMNLVATRFRNLGPTFDPATARRNTWVGTDAGYKSGRLNCANYVAYLIGDPVFYRFYEHFSTRLIGDPPHPWTADRETDPRYVRGVLINGVYWPADIAPGVNGGYIEVIGSSSRVSYPDAHLFARPLPSDGGTVAVYYNGARIQ